jgi:hypothetical protein
MNHTLAHFNEEVLTRENAWTAASILTVIAGAMMGRFLLKCGWRAMTGNEPPENPDGDDTNWKQALIWGVVSGAIMGVVRALSQKGASAAERRWG